MQLLKVDHTYTQLAATCFKINLYELANFFYELSTLAERYNEAYSRFHDSLEELGLL